MGGKAKKKTKKEEPEAAQDTVFHVDCDPDTFNALSSVLKDDVEPSISAHMDHLDTESTSFKSLAEKWSCVFCGTILPPPSGCFVCRAGHMTCEICNRNFHKILWDGEKWPYKCPYFIESEGVVDEESICNERMFALYEPMYTHVQKTYRTLPCPFEAHGCRLKLETVNLDRHEAVCPFNPSLGCPYKDCERGCMTCRDLVDHLVRAHKAVLVDLNSNKSTGDPIEAAVLENIDKAKEYTWIPIVYKYQGCHIFLTVELQDGNYYLWLESVEKRLRNIQPQMLLQFSGHDAKRTMEWEPPQVEDFRIYTPQVKHRSAFSRTADKFLADFVELQGTNGVLKVLLKM